MRVLKLLALLALISVCWSCDDDDYVQPVEECSAERFVEEYTFEDQWGNPAIFEEYFENEGGYTYGALFRSDSLPRIFVTTLRWEQGVFLSNGQDVTLYIDECTYYSSDSLFVVQ